MVCGAGAGLVTKTCIAPLERIKILFQVQGMMKGETNHYGRTITGAIRTIYHENGIMGFYHGNAANCLRVMPNYALKFMFNDTFKELVRKPGQKQLGFNQLMIAGSLAGSFQLTMTYPLEVIRARTSMSAAFGNHYSGMLDCAVQTVRKEGWLALYNGYPISLIAGTPYVGFQMTFNTMLLRYMPLDPDTGKVPIHFKLLGGALAGLSAQSIIYPGDTMRRRMQVDGIDGAKKVYRNFFHCFQSILATEGVMGLYRGIGANALRCIPGAAIQFTAYDCFKAALGLGKKGGTTEKANKGKTAR